MKKTILSFFFIMNTLLCFSQEIPNSVKNKMIDFLFKENQYNESDLKDLLKDISQNKNTVFWFKEVSLSCENDIRLFYFGSSKEHSKLYAILIKANGENLILGSDFFNDNNKIFYFIQFYKEKDILCFYNNIFPLIISNVYELNLKKQKNHILFYK